jgi:hypothetical protein
VVANDFARKYILQDSAPSLHLNNALAFPQTHETRETPETDETPETRLTPEALSTSETRETVKHLERLSRHLRELVA